MKKVKNRHRVLLFTNNKVTENDILMLLSAHGYLVDTASSYNNAIELLSNYKHSIFIADVQQLPQSPAVMIQIFQKIRKKPVFLIIDESEPNEQTQAYLDTTVDDIISLPVRADKLYRKVKRAAEFNRMQHEIEYHSGMLFILRMLVPILMVLVFILTNR